MNNVDQLKINNKITDLESDEKNTENNEKYSFVLETIKEESYQSLEFIRNIDKKFNLMLLYNSAMITSIGVLMPIKNDIINSAVIYSFLSLFIINILISVMSIMLGFYPKKIISISPKEFSKKTLYSKPLDIFFRTFIKTYENIIKNNRLLIKKKMKYFKISFICSSLSLVLLSLLIIFKLI